MQHAVHTPRGLAARAASHSSHGISSLRWRRVALRGNTLAVSALEQEQDDTVGNLESMTSPTETVESTTNAKPVSASSQKEVNKFASTFAPRASGSTGRPNPAYKGSWLYTVFDVQAWAALVIGGLLSFNVIFPSDKPDIARLMGMWSIWMFTIPSLRARECTQNEKNALNILFLLVPLANVLLPFVWKDFGFIFTCDVALLFGVFAWKGYWNEDEEVTNAE